MLEVDVATTRGEAAIEARFKIDEGVTALFGPSGSGKTTVLSMIAGIIRPRSGRVLLDGQALFDADRGIDIPPERRHIGVVFQDRRLFPHLSVAGNLNYGFRLVPHAERVQSFNDVVALLGLDRLLERKPLTLSGGEQQRVAIGRALLMSPRVLLMDEPLASLDGRRKDEILPYLEKLRDAVRLPIVYVTHDQREVSRLARRTLEMRDGCAREVVP
ncbi:MAG: ATP-binding cassette domain-containing protein [Alphaproteobacteria bacterium]|nr:ATP-binding cassette domain-containing protein [Alphaproteobacteria bacterium]